jgi:hypothetical protein
LFTALRQPTDYRKLELYDKFVVRAGEHGHMR